MKTRQHDHEPFRSFPMVFYILHRRCCLRPFRRGSYQLCAVMLGTMAPKNTYTSTTLRFDLSEVSSSGCVLRRGRLSLKGREPIDTPHYLPPSSRGCVPHITQDTARSNTGIKGIYVALEDCEWSKSDVKRIIFLSHANPLLL